MTDYSIEHQIDRNRFVLIQDNNECVLDYSLNDASNANVINFTHTYVPFRLRGKGLAEILVEHGLKWAKEHDFKIEADCWYVAKYLE